MPSDITVTNRFAAGENTTYWAGIGEAMAGRKLVSNVAKVMILSPKPNSESLNGLRFFVKTDDTKTKLSIDLN